MQHDPLFAAEVIRKGLIVLKRLSDSRYICVIKNPEGTSDKLTLEPVALDILVFQELDCSLSRRHLTRGRHTNSSKGV